MSSSSCAANDQARALLETLCQFMLPIIQTALGQTMDSKDIRFGIEADAFVNELEKFIASVISCTQPRNQDIAIKATLDESGFDPWDVKDLLQWEISITTESDAKLHFSSSDERNSDDIPANHWNTLTDPALEEDLGNKLQLLRKHVTQKMPIRLLYFEPHNTELKIFLWDRADVYNHLVNKFRANFNEDSELTHDMDLWLWQNAGYAILSHTWGQTPGELTYGDWKNHSLDATKPKCRKLINFCKAAYKDYELTFGWIDTVCINKESSAELDESIRSMYAWYRSAIVCITYLAGTKVITEMHKDPWFTRGWTFQELVAPSLIKFYNMDWNQLSIGSNYANDKRSPSIQTEIRLATTITSKELANLDKASVSRRMQLAAMRQVTREEDIAYCLMGIFDVSISTAYGEGADRAFFRLLEEIFRSTKDMSDIFNWAGDRNPYSREPTTSLFPSHPSDYLKRSSHERLRPWRPIAPLTLTHLGLRTPILLMPAVPIVDSDKIPPSPIGDYFAYVFVSPCTLPLPENYSVLDKRASGPEGVYVEKRTAHRTEEIALTFGTLNVEEQGTKIHILPTCLAVLLKRRVRPFSSCYEKVYTNTPIVFTLMETRHSGALPFLRDHYEVERSELAKHGMQLVTVYL